MLWTAPHRNPRATTSALVFNGRVPGQRWYHLICFGSLGHYYEDGGCEHTDEVLQKLSPYGKRVVKLQPFGGQDKRPRRFARRAA